MKISRRRFIRDAAAAGAAVAFPSIVPSRVLGADAPSNTLNVAQIGCGRIGLTMDVPGFLRASGARVSAVCDLDSRRLANMRAFVAKRQGEKSPEAIAAVRDFHDLLSCPGIDAVSISTPDHWHAQIAIEAAFAGKHVYMQKPASRGATVCGRDCGDWAHVPSGLAAALLAPLPKGVCVRARGAARQSEVH